MENQGGENKSRNKFDFHEFIPFIVDLIYIYNIYIYIYIYICNIYTLYNIYKHTHIHFFTKYINIIYIYNIYIYIYTYINLI